VCRRRGLINQDSRYGPGFRREINARWRSPTAMRNHATWHVIASIFASMRDQTSVDASLIDAFGCRLIRMHFLSLLD
jgi:hypothetical protein